MTVIVMDQMRSVSVTSNGPTSLITVSQTGMQGPQGNPTVVNGKSGATITLVASDVGAIATTARGAANGVAELDSGGLVPIAELPLSGLAGNFVDLSTNQAIASGVKTFSVSPVVPTPTTSTQAANKSYVDGLVVTAGTGLTKAGTVISLTSPVAIVNGGTGSTTQNFVDLTTAQASIGGNKTFTGVVTHSSTTTLTGAVTASASVSVGTTLSVTSTSTFGNQVTVNSSNVAGSLNITQSVPTTGNPGTISVNESASTNGSLGLYVSSDTVARFSMTAAGVMSWGPGGSTAQDANLYRSSTNVLKTDHSFFVVGNLTVTASSTFNNTINLNGQLLVANGSNPGVRMTGSTTGQQLYDAIGADATTVAYESEVTGDSIHRFAIYADGQHQWGGGTSGRDTTLVRSGAGVLTLSSNLIINNTLKAGTNVTVGATATLGSGGVGLLEIANITTALTGNPTGGGVLYVSSGVPHWVDPGGHVLGMVRSYFATCTTSLASFTTETDVPGATFNVVVTGSNATVNIEGTMDCNSGTSACTITGFLNWNGSDQAAQIVFEGATGDRGTVGQQWQITGVTAGTYTCKLRASCTASGSSNTVRLTHTNISATVIEG